MSKPTPVYRRDGIEVYHGDCKEVLAELDVRVSACVTDPPYGLSFMGRDWDHGVPGEAFWRIIGERMLPGAHLAAFGGSRTYHRLAVAIEDAGYEIRDTLQWLYGSGFPKSLDVSKAIDRADQERHERALPVTRFLADAMKAKGLARRDLNRAVVGADNDAGSAQSWTTVTADGAHKPRVPTWDQWLQLKSLLGFGDEMDAEVWRLNGRKGKPSDNWEKREVIGKSENGIAGGTKRHAGQDGAWGFNAEHDITAPATPEAERWQGFGTALKPSHEPIVLSRKPLTPVPLEPKIQEELTHLLGGLVCQSASFANNAEPSSASSLNVHAEASVSALLLAAVLHGELSDDPSAGMGTFRSPEAASTCLNIAASWNSILVALSDPRSTFTTETMTGLTTALRTLSCLISPTMPEHIIQAVSRPVGSLWSASTADDHSSDDDLNTSGILSAIARELATLQHGDGSTDAKSAAASSLATIQSVDSVLSRALHELTTASGGKLRPDNEPIILARRPLSGTVAATVLQHGTGALNIDGTRVSTTEKLSQGSRKPGGNFDDDAYQWPGRKGEQHDAGRWPSNVLLAPDAAALLDQMSGERAPGRRGVGKGTQEGIAASATINSLTSKPMYSDKGGASKYFPVLPIDDPDTLRFRYCSKSSKRDRTANGTVTNGHPTCKPTSLMRWLVTLVSPPDGIVLDPFAGSGTTGVACAQLGVRCILIEQEAEYLPIIIGRIDHALDERAAGKRWGNGTDPSRAGAPRTTHKDGSRFTGNGMWSEKQGGGGLKSATLETPPARWPANVLMDREAAAVLDQMSGERPVSGSAKNGRPATGTYAPGYGGNIGKVQGRLHNDSGGASRFMIVLDDGEPEPDGPPAPRQLGLMTGDD